MAKEARQTPLTVYLEPTLWALMQKAVLQDDTTASSYLRNLIIDDLRQRGIITEEIMTGMLKGTNLRDALAAMEKIMNEPAVAVAVVANANSSS